MVDIKGLDKEREVDSIRAEQKNGEGAAKDADGERKKPTLEEEIKLTKDAIGKILEILAELPPSVCYATIMYLRIILPGSWPMGGMAGLMMGGPFTLPPLRLVDDQKKRDIEPPFPFDISFSARNG